MRFVLGMTGRIPGAKLGASVYQLPSRIFPATLSPTEFLDVIEYLKGLK